MPTPTEILNGLALTANEMTALAVVWHVFAALAIIGIIFGWRPSRKTGASLSALPLLSVSVLAWIYSNPFNGTVFLLFAVVLIIIGLRMPHEKIQKAPTWALIFGALMIVFGWIYPHFLEGGSWFKYLYAAPLGLIPCPTLSFTIGFALIANGFSSRAWSIILAAIGAFYGIFGAFRLGVHIDFVLLAGSLLLLIQAITLKPSLTKS
ncbi:MAG: hypothetical protein GF421_05885 [Candidatus Aminicenantes bacterium]|nr:hypothetical protein [Candidatus Aminicenantes bacterium]